MNLLESFGCDEDIDVFGEPAETVLVQRHPAHHGVRDAEVAEPLGDLAERVLDRALFLEETATFAQGPPPVLIQAFLVRDQFGRN